jgi:hypothetical protein
MVDEKNKLVFDVVFEIYKIFLGAGLTLLGACIIQIAFIGGGLNTGIILIILILTYIGYISVICGGILYDIWARL